MVIILKGIFPVATAYGRNGMIVIIIDIGQTIYRMFSCIETYRIGVGGIGREIYTQPTIIANIIKTTLPIGGQKCLLVLHLINYKHLSFPPTGPIITLVTCAKGQVPFVRSF